MRTSFRARGAFKPRVRGLLLQWNPELNQNLGIEPRGVQFPSGPPTFEFESFLALPMLFAGGRTDSSFASADKRQSAELTGRAFGFGLRRLFDKKGAEKSKVCGVRDHP